MKILISKPVKSEQYLTLLILFGFTILNLIWYLLSENKNILIILLLSVVISIVIIYCQSKIYEISIDGGLIVISNVLHKSINKSKSHFKYIERFIPLAGLFYIYFNDGSRFLYLVDGETANRTIFGDIKKIEEELGQKLRRQLNDDRS